MKITISKSQWEGIGKKAGWMGEDKECDCGSGNTREVVKDARGIFLGYMCSKCKKQKLAKYRPEVLDNPNYESDEPIEPED